MAVFELIIGAILSTILTIPSMLFLYHKWIIPKILAGVRQELPPAILKIVDEKIQDVKDYMTEQFESARMAIIGKAGNTKRIEGLAAKFLMKNGITPDTLDEVATKYGAEILDTLSKKAAATKESSDSNWS